MELLIWTRNRGGVDTPKGYGDWKAGDVIDAHPDGWAWSPAELTNPAWRILRVPLTQAECDALCSKASGDPTVQPLYKRRYKLDFTFAALPIGLKQYALDDTRGVPIFDASTAVVQIRAAVVLKA